MKAILIPAVTVLLILYVIMFMIDHQWWPEAVTEKIRNVFLVLFALYLCYELANIHFLKKGKQENALVYKVASGGKKTFLKAAEYIRPFQKEFLIWLAVAAVLSFAGFITMGIIGYLWLEIPVQLGLATRIQGDNLWPATIFMAILWPFCLPAGVLVKHYLIRQGYTSWALTGWIGAAAGGIFLLIFLVYRMFGKR
jgi:hypothetical protein